MSDDRKVLTKLLIENTI